MEHRTPTTFGTYRQLEDGSLVPETTEAPKPTQAEKSSSVDKKPTPNPEA